MMMTTNPPRYGPGPRPRFAPSRVQTSTRQISPGSIHPVSLTRASPQSGQRGANVRHEPYPGARPKKPVRFDPQSHKRLSQSSPMQSPSETVSAPNIPSEIIKTEPKDNHENAEKSSAGSGIENSVTEPNLSSADNSQPPTLRDEGSESSSSTIINEPTEVKYSDNLPPGGLSLDPDFSNFPRLMDTSSDSAATDPNVNIKVEAVADSDDLEITGVEPGQMAQPDYGMMPNLQSQMGYDPSLSSGAQGSVGDPSSQGYSKSL